MKRFRLVGLGLLAIGLVGIAGLTWARNHYGDIRPVIFPPKRAADTGPNAMGLQLPEDLRLTVFAQNLGNARDLELTESGTLLLSIPGGGKVVALPDRNSDGQADETKEIITGLNKPHGLAFHKGKLYVAEETRLARYSWDESTLTARLEKALLSLPRGGRHTTRSLVFNQSEQLFISLGSTCDVCVEDHPWIGTVIVTDAEGRSPRVYAKGLRNAVFLTLLEEKNQIWATEMGRDFLGDNLPPDEVNTLKEAADYGWPFCYGNKVPDQQMRSTAQRCNATETPAFEIPAHSAPLGLAFIKSEQLPDEWQGDLLVSYHGSWNRSAPTGYKVVRLDYQDGRLASQEDFITGFIQGSQAAGRPVDLIFNQRGDLFLSDDKAGAVYLIKKR